jgi:hypothetical protein
MTGVSSTALSGFCALERYYGAKALRVMRDYLIFKAGARGYARDQLITAIDDYAEELTGDRTALHAKPASIGR